MLALELIRFLLVLLVPGLLGALAFSIAYRLKTDMNFSVAMILNFLTFIIMIAGLYFIKHVNTMSDLRTEFTCLHFTTIYALLSMWINIILGVIFGLIRRLFFWIRR